MKLLNFSSQAELVNAIKSKIIPLDIVQAPAYVMRDKDNIAIALEVPMPEQLEKDLVKLGLVKTLSTSRSKKTAIRHWLELVNPVKLNNYQHDYKLVIFRFNDSNLMLAFVHELLRLGCDRLEFLQYQLSEQVKINLIKVVSPPYYSLLKGLDQVSGITVYAPVKYHRQELVWLQCGYSHALISHCKLNCQQLILIDSCGRWNYFNKQQWQSLYQLSEVKLSNCEAQVFNAKPAEKIPIQLRLWHQARQKQTTLWLINQQAENKLTALVRQLSQQQLTDILFAVGTVNEQLIVLLKTKLPYDRLDHLEIAGIGFASFAGIENLFLPDQTVLRPQLRAEKLQQLFAADPDKLTLIYPPDYSNNNPCLLQVPIDAFYVLENWVDYLLNCHQAELQIWRNSCCFEFTAVQTIAMEWSEEQLNNKVIVAEKPAQLPENSIDKSFQLAVNIKDVQNDACINKNCEQKTWQLELDDNQQIIIRTAITDLQQNIIRLQQQYLALSVPAQHRQRRLYWQQLAVAYTKAGNESDAAQCFSRLIWQAETDEQKKKLGLQWYKAEQCLAKNAASVMDKILYLDDQKTIQSSVVQVRLLIAGLIAGVLNHSEQQLVRNGLNACMNLLDVRSVWLAEVSLSKLVGDDLLRLFSVRDELFARLTNGLSLYPDAPSFIKFTNADSMLAVMQIEQAFEQLLNYYDSIERKQSDFEQDVRSTNAYVYLVFAWGFCKLQRPARAKQLQCAAKAMVDCTDPVHHCLFSLFQRRIDQALQGKPCATPLGLDLQLMIERLDTNMRYKVDRLRQALFVLEDYASVEPFCDYVQATSFAETIPIDFSTLYTSNERQYLVKVLERLIRQANVLASDDPLRYKIISKVLNEMPRLGRGHSQQLLDKILMASQNIDAINKSLVLAKCLFMASSHAHNLLLKQIISELQLLLQQLSQIEIATVMPILSYFFIHVQQQTEVKPEINISKKLFTSLAKNKLVFIEAGLYLHSCMDDNENIQSLDILFTKAEQHLLSKKLTVEQRLSLTQAMVTACRCLDSKSTWLKLNLLAQQLTIISDSYSSNSHYCLSVVRFIEILVRGLLNDNLFAGKAIRQWLAHDELLVRERIQSDLESLLK